MTNVITDWSVQVVFYYDTNDQTEIFATKQFNKLSESDIKGLCEKNASILFKTYPRVEKIEFEADDIHRVDVGFKKHLYFKFYRNDRQSQI